MKTTTLKKKTFEAIERFVLENETIQYLYKKSKSNKNQQRIREFLFVSDEIGISHDYKTDFGKVKLNRQMREYEIPYLSGL